MAIGYSRSRRYPFHLKEEMADGFPFEKRTTFFIRPMTAAMRAEFDEHCQSVNKKGEEGIQGFGTWAIRILADCLVDWSNFTDPDGCAIPFLKSPSGGAAESTLDLLRPQDRYEIALAIISGSALSGDDRKN